MQPYITDTFLVLLNGALFLAAAVANTYLKKYTNLQISQANLELFTKAADARAGAWVAKEEPGWEKKIVTANDPWIIKEGVVVMQNLEKEGIVIGMTPMKLRTMIAGGIGKLQALALSRLGAAPSVVTSSGGGIGTAGYTPVGIAPGIPQAT